MDLLAARPLQRLLQREVLARLVAPALGLCAAHLPCLGLLLPELRAEPPDLVAAPPDAGFEGHHGLLLRELQPSGLGTATAAAAAAAARLLRKWRCAAVGRPPGGIGGLILFRLSPPSLILKLGDPALQLRMQLGARAHVAHWLGCGTLGTTSPLQPPLGGLSHLAPSGCAGALAVLVVAPALRNCRFRDDLGGSLHLPWVESGFRVEDGLVVRGEVEACRDQVDVPVDRGGALKRLLQLTGLLLRRRALSAAAAAAAPPHGWPRASTGGWVAGRAAGRWMRASSREG
mmetsp:Transcript_32457/g.85869  ORF Transcript_32457/g.85869 Transcript_32457/m.85869 type:complete len:288 (+) Transcript_32457:254-1117(+)